jgi:hypothetical protein
MQCKEEESRAGGREAWPIKIIEMAGKTLERTLVNSDPFNGNVCSDNKCLLNSNSDSKINYRRNCICYKITCMICLKDGKSGDMSTCYYGESGKNMHCRAKEHLSKFNSKKEDIRSESAFYKHLVSTHGGKNENKSFSDYFGIEILKAYNKPFTKCVEEGTLIANHQGELLNSKSEWHQAKVICTTLTVVQGGAEVVTQQRPGRVQGGQDTAGQGHQSGQGEQGGQERRVGQQQQRDQAGQGGQGEQGGQGGQNQRAGQQQQPRAHLRRTTRGNS